MPRDPCAHPATKCSAGETVKQMGIKPRPEAAPEQRRRSEKIQRQLDEALEESFPASDPVSIVTSQDEEDWGNEPEDSGKPPSPATGPSAPKSNRPD